MPEYHHRKGFGGFVKVVVVHSHLGGYPISYCEFTLQLKVFHRKVRRLCLLEKFYRVELQLPADSVQGSPVLSLESTRQVHNDI